MYKILDPGNEADAAHLAEMHHLRYKRFYRDLNWRNGLIIYSQMEFDQYDHENARYIVHLNNLNHVDACARIIHTDNPYLLGDTFGHLVTDTEIPRTKDAIEISRLCSDARTAPKRVVGELMACFLEYGLNYNIQQYVSFSDIQIKPYVTQFGWQYNQIGPECNTGTDISAALEYSVTQNFYHNVKSVSRIPCNRRMLANMPEVNFSQGTGNCLVLK